MKINNGVWSRWIECDCHSEGIMISHDDTDPYPNINLAMFSHGKYDNNALSFKEKLRYCWNLFRTGKPFLDEVMLGQRTARELANHLLEFANKNYSAEIRQKRIEINNEKEI